MKSLMRCKSQWNLVPLLVLMTASVGWSAEDTCFFKHSGIEKIPGAEFLPESVCLSQVRFEDRSSGLFVSIDGDPFVGVYPVQEVTRKEDVIKYMTYLYRHPFQTKGQPMEATIRFSLDVQASSNEVDYLYLASEFFVYHPDGSHDVHIYYYRREKKQE